jgi:hypothetical protein
MRCIMIFCTIFLLSFNSVVIGEDLQVYEGYVPRYGDY